MATLVYTESGQPVTLTSELGKGGEGTIYTSPLDDLGCAKIYQKGVSADTHAKLRLMVRRPPSDPTYKTRQHRSISWPSALLYSDNKGSKPVGFFMPRIDLKFFQNALVYCDPPDRSARFGGGFSWKHLFTAATNIASAVSAIHEQGYCVGDLNESNILIAPSALVSLIDCDSFQVPDPESGRVHRCGVGKKEYTAPEFMDKRFDEVDRTIASDSFAFAVLAFQLLMEGTHPYSAKGKLVEDASSIEAKIRLGYFPYGARRRDISPPDHAPPYDILPPEMQKFFDRCFAAGHKEPSNRPTPREWYDLFRRLESQFQQCATNPNHLFLGHLRSCPWCDIRATRGRDPFMSPIGQQIALDNGTVQLESVEKRIEYLQPYVVMAFADGVLTTEEKNYLNALGSRLQIPVKEVDKLIQAEAKRVKGKLGSSTGNPQLEVSKTAFQFENIHRGTRISGKYVIANIGGGSLQGAIRSSHQWLKVSQSLIDTSRHRQEHEFVGDTSQLALGSKNCGSIDIDSNGGNVRLQVSVSIEIEKSALSRYGQVLFWMGALVGGIFGYFLYNILPDIPSRNMVSGIAGLVGLLGAIVVGSRTGGFAGGCGTLIIGSIVLGVLQSTLPAAYSILAWATTLGSLLHTCARPLFISKHAGKSTAFVGVAAGALALSAAIIVGGLSLRDQVILSKATVLNSSAPPLQMGTVATCGKASGWGSFIPKNEFLSGDPICVYAEALNVNQGGRIDVTFAVALKNSNSITLVSQTNRLKLRDNAPSGWYPWQALRLPPNSPPGVYVAEVSAHNNLTNQTGVSSAKFTVVGETQPTSSSADTSDKLVQGSTSEPGVSNLNVGNAESATQEPVSTSSREVEAPSIQSPGPADASNEDTTTTTSPTSSDVAGPVHNANPPATDMGVPLAHSLLASAYLQSSNPAQLQGAAAEVLRNGGSVTIELMHEHSGLSGDSVHPVTVTLTPTTITYDPGSSSCKYARFSAPLKSVQVVEVSNKAVEGRIIGVVVRHIMPGTYLLHLEVHDPARSNEKVKLYFATADSYTIKQANNVNYLASRSNSTQVLGAVTNVIRQAMSSSH